MARPDVPVAIAIALVSATFLFVGLDRYGVVNSDEAIYHGISERMVETGDWLELDFRGEPRVYDTFMNAPLHYWARAALISALGSNAFTMRALSALFGVLAVLATYGLGCRLVGRTAALLAAAVLLTTFQFVYLHGARTGELDTIAVCLITASCWTFLRAVQHDRSFVPHHLILAALGMTKLPLVVVPVAAELCWLALHPGARRHVRRYVTVGLAVAPFALLWHGAQAWLERDQVTEVFRTMASQAASDPSAGSRPVHAPHEGPLGNAWFYAKVVLYGTFPWSAAFPLAIAAAFARSANSARRRHALLFAAVVVVFFVFVSKHYPWYVMPAYPFLAILVGAWLVDGVRDRAPWTGAGLGFVWAACLWLDVGVFETNPFAQRALVIPMETTGRSWLPIGPAAAVTLVGLAWACVWLAISRRIPARVRSGLGVACAASLLGYAGARVAAPLAHLDHQSPVQRIRNEIDRARASGTPLELPIPLGRPPVEIARFLFAEDFEIVTRPAEDGVDLVLHRRGDPRVLGSSIGRAGLEWRRERAQDDGGSGARPES